MSKISTLRYGRLLKLPRKLVAFCVGKMYPIVRNVYDFPQVMSIPDTLHILAQNRNQSIIRFGDSEFLYIVDKLNLPYQNYDKNLANKLIQILRNDTNHIMVGLPVGYHSMENLSKEGKSFWKTQIVWTYPRIRKYIDVKKIYANASITRIYAEYEKKDHCREWFEKFMKLWEDQEIILLEGEKSRIGVGNNLLSNAKSVIRILAPQHHAFDKYDEILETVLSMPQNKLVLVSLGPCAKALAYDLAKSGYRVLDIGNLDIEYEWYLMQSKAKVKIKGKYTSEVLGGREVEHRNESEYINQIKVRIV